MKKYTLFYFIVFGLIYTVLFNSCTKDTGDYNYSNPKTPFEGTVYEYLKSKPGVFDSLLIVIDRMNMAPLLNSGGITLFAPTNDNFQIAVSKLNDARKKAGKPMIYLNNYTINFLDSMICRYVIDDRTLPSDSMTTADGLTVRTHKYGYPMNFKKGVTRSQGFQNGGASLINISDTRRSIFKANWLTSTANSIDIRTSDGSIIHVMEPGHVFGFNDYFKPVRSPFKGVPFEFPESINSSKILEAEDFDLGGQGVAYKSTSKSNTEKNYRPNEGFRISQHGVTATPVSLGISWPSIYDIFGVSAGDWVTYTINVKNEGDYRIYTHYRTRLTLNASTVTRYRFDVDDADATGIISNVGDVVNRYADWGASEAIIHFKPGIHALKFFWVTNGMDVDAFHITRIN